ncbi:hypothetical protein [Nocardioides campestrisoli]|uniref:hypothetical protein n=1 Tax=Nocardioides campestrisoli TaxID=2736757 RepID=UPI0015E7B033|nr:hypothetical protein [Nocardioides campestrisoli]
MTMSIRTSGGARFRGVRRTLATVLATGLATLLVVGVVAVPAGAAGSGLASGAGASATGDARTRVLFTVPDCEGCKIQLHQARRTPRSDVRTWSSRVRRVEAGTVSFRPATRRTHGMSATVRAPWEGQTGYVTTVAWRYGGKQVGDPVTLPEALAKQRASACWEGVRGRRVTIPLVVAQVEVDGVHGRVPGSIAFVPSTQAWLPPMRRTFEGVLGSQDVNICR